MDRHPNQPSQHRARMQRCPGDQAAVTQSLGQGFCCNLLPRCVLHLLRGGSLPSELPGFRLVIWCTHPLGWNEVHVNRDCVSWGRVPIPPQGCLLSCSGSPPEQLWDRLLLATFLKSRKSWGRVKPAPSPGALSLTSAQPGLYSLAMRLLFLSKTAVASRGCGSRWSLRTEQHLVRTEAFKVSPTWRCFF